MSKLQTAGPWIELPGIDWLTVPPRAQPDYPETTVRAIARFKAQVCRRVLPHVDLREIGHDGIEVQFMGDRLYMRLHGDAVRFQDELITMKTEAS